MDIDLIELDEFLPINRRIPSPHFLSVKEVAHDILQNRCGIFSTTSLRESIDIDAANFLVDECLLIATDDLFEDRDEVDPEGYVKYVPDDLNDMMFITRLLEHNIDPTSYLKNITLPKVWRNRLSADGIRILRTMKFYRDILDSAPSPELSSDDEPTNSIQSDEEETIPIQSDKEETIPIQRSSHNIEDLTSSSNQLYQYRYAVDISCCDLNDVENGFGNSNNKRTINSNSDFSSVTLDTTSPKKICLRQNDDNCVVVQQQDIYVPIDRPKINWNSFRKQMVGLTNTDNATCYINAALQCLASTPPLVDWLFDQYDQLSTCRLSNQGLFCSICEVTKIIRLIYPSPRNIILEYNRSSVPSADSIRTHVHLISPILRAGHQQDVTEFFTFLFDHFVTCLSSHFPTSNVLASTPTIIDQIFSFKIQSSLQCSSCPYTSDTVESLNILSVAIDKLNNLTDALAHFVNRETLKDSTCGNCGKKNQMNKRVTLHELPPILIITFIRHFGSIKSLGKLSHLVNYNELLDVSPYMSSHLNILINKNQEISSSNNYIYKLYAVINHVGESLHHGHYYSYIRSSNGLWFLVNDAHCRNVSSNEVFNHPEAYMLFYAKAFDTSANNNPTFQQQQQSSMILSTENISTVSNPSSISNLSVLANPISFDQSTIPRNGQSLTKKISINTMNITSHDHLERQMNSKPKSKNALSIVDPREITPVASPIPGHTESTITIGARCSKNQIKEKPKDTDCTITRNTDDLSWQPMSHTRFSSLSHDISDDSVDGISRNEETRKEKCKKLASVASGVSINKIFEKTLKSVHHITLNETELIKMNRIRQQELKKIKDRKMQMLGLAPVPPLLRTKSSKTGPASVIIETIRDDQTYQKNKNTTTYTKVNIEYLNLLLPHLKHYNAACALCVKTRYFGKNISSPASLLVKCILKCSGKDCKFKCVVYLFNNGSGIIAALNSQIFHHVSERLSRPIRGSRRQAIKDKFKAGGSVYRIHAEYDKKRTINEKQGFNYDATGKSKKIFKKIKAEVTAESLLSPDVTLSILHFHDQLTDSINSEGIIKGALQIVQLRPFCIVSFTEASIRLYDAIVSHPESVLSWDATGGVVKNTASTSKQCLYYELTISHPNIVNEDSLVPLTFMLSESQTLFTIINWLTAFKESHKKIFPHKKDAFPRPAVILSDRAQVFLQAGLRVFNNESYQEFLARAYRIVTNKAIGNDLSKTNIHACLSHFMLEMRKRVNKYLPDNLRELAMWCVALLVNTSTWDEMKENWRLICEVFLNYSTNETVNFKINHSILLTHISQITNDLNSSAAINQSRQTLSDSNDPFEFNDDDIENDILEPDQLHCDETNKSTTTKKRLKKSRVGSSANDKSVIDEEQQLNQIDSSFKQDLQKIYDECRENNARSTASHSSSGDKTSKSVKQWLAYFNQCCIPTIVTWSNLLLGNLNRYVTSSIRAFDNLLLTTHDHRTNAISERRMGIVKRTQLGTQTYMRSDVVLQILVEDMQRMIENFSISYMAVTSEDDNNEIHQQQLKELKEHWKQKSRRGHGFYAKKPETTVMNNLKYSLIASSISINEGLSIPHLFVLNWLNAAIGLLISIKWIRESLPLSPIKSTTLLNEILTFVDKWMSSLNRIKPPKKTSSEQMQLLNTEFHLPIDVPTSDSEQLNFILHDILLPTIDQSISTIRMYYCTSCKFTVNTRYDISYIPINGIEEQFQLRHRLNNYFGDSASDHLCEKCSMTMIRQIKLLECPPVIILSIDHTKNSSTILRKPPNSICLQSFLEKSNIGCSSSSTYDIIAFLSIMPNVDSKVVLTTKIKQRWRVSSMTKLIGNGDRLCQLWANSRLIILERVRTCDSNFLYAIAQCCTANMIDVGGNNFKTYKTLHEAVKTIETEPTFARLYDTLSSRFTTYYKCLKCQASPHSLSTTHKCVSIYEMNGNDLQPHATPIIWQSMLDFQCSVCGEKTENVILPTFIQIHHDYPSIFMYRLSRTTLQAVLDLRIELNNQDGQCGYVYKPVSILVVDQFNAISVIKIQNNLIYCKSPYQVPTSLCNNEINELFDTAASVVVFFQQDRIATTISISQDAQQLPSDPEESNVVESLFHVEHTTSSTTTTTTLLQAPLPVRLINTSTGTSICGTVKSLTIRK